MRSKSIGLQQEKVIMQTNVIDSAVSFPSENGKMEVGEWFELADKWGISHAIASPTGEFVAVYNDEGNALMAELVEQYPDRISGLAVANPWYGKKAVDILKRAFERGLCGLYLHPPRQGFQLTEAVVDPLIEVCIAHDKPVYSHTGTPICAMPFQLAELARRFGEATFVMGHMGWSDFAGYDAIPAAGQAPNIIIETSYTTTGLVKGAIETIGVERVLFGTGYPQSHPGPEFEKLKPLNLPDDILNKFVSENAIRVWRIKT
ncbi:MAG: amidohydrolase family protein [Planctomycetota bacterium]|nr:amidohydrolase family protein [Planctomycetota bacterium]